MNSTSLYPPNNHELSDEVIGNLTRPTWDPRDLPDNRILHQSRLQPLGQYPKPPSSDCKGMAGATLDTSVTRQEPQAPAIAPRMMRPRPLLTTSRRRKPTSSWNKALQSIAILQASGYEMSEQQQRTIMEDVLKKRYRHRHLQASYKRKANESMEKTKHDIRHLRCAVGELQQRVMAIQLGTQPKLNVGAIVRRYQQQFRAFVSDPASQKPSAMAFLLCILAPAVISDPIYGVEAILENWRLTAGHFEDVHLELNDLKTLATGILVGSTTTFATISERTLRVAFPHLNSDGMGGLKGGEWSPPAIKLLGKKLVMRGSLLFHLDHTSNRVVWIDSEADMLSPMMQILGSLECVHQVLRHALITPDFRSRVNSLSVGAHSA